MAIEKMALVNILGRMDALDEVLQKCCEDDSFHPEQAMTFLDDTEGYQPIHGDNPYASTLGQLETLSKLHDPPLSPEGGEGAPAPDEELFPYLQKAVAEFAGMDESTRRLAEEITADEAALAQLSHFSTMDVRLADVFSCEFIRVRFGKIPRDSYPKLAAYEDNPYLVFFPGSSDATHYWGAYFCPAEQAQEIDRIFSHLYFERLRVPDIDGTPKEGIEQLTKQIAEKKKALEESREESRRRWAEQNGEMSAAYARLSFLSDAFDLRRFAARHGELFHLVGWVPRSQEKEFSARFAEIDTVEVMSEPPTGNEKLPPPSRLKNGWFVRPFEMFVEMFGTPDYDEPDPSLFVSLTYCLLFGIMFADVGQALLLFIAGAVMWKKMKLPLGAILMRASVFCAIFGAIFGSVFGFEELLDPFYASVLPKLPFKVMDSDNITLILLASIVIGFALNVASMLINIFSSLRRKRYEDALFGPSGVAGLVFYVSLLAGAALMFLGTNVFTPVYIICLIVLPLVVMFFREPLGALVSRKPYHMDGVGEFIAGNFFEAFEFLLSYLSNTLSYLRVGAFVLVHAGMMKVVFVIAELFDPVGFVIAVVIGNLIVACLEGLLVGIQCLRLEYYEMFSRFYSGEGRPFVCARAGSRTRG